MAAGTKTDPWALSTPPGTATYTIYRDEHHDPPALICRVGSTTLTYHLRAVEDLHAWLKTQPDWVSLGAVDERKTAAPDTVEAWGRSSDNPVGGWYGLRSGYRGRFGMYIPPLLEALGLAELTHDPRSNRMRDLSTPTRRGTTVPVTRIIRYTTSPGNAVANERLVGDVFAELSTTRPDGLRYAAFRLEDGTTFVHLAIFDGDDNPLTASAAFAQFQLGIADRCTAGPAAAEAALIGSYRLLPDTTPPALDQQV